MKLIECYIENFGTLSKTKINFSQGINCFVSDNGSGKTTLTVFLSSMLYGLADTRHKSIDDNERKKYAPWQGGRYGGSLTIEIRGREYVIERSFGNKAPEDTFALYERESGRPSNDYTERLGEELFGIDREGFLLTVFLSEKNLTGRSSNQTVSAKLSNLVGVEGDIGAYDAARKLLEDKRKHYYKQSENCEIARVKSKIREKRFEYDRLTLVCESLFQKEEEIKRKKLALSEAKKERDKLRDAAIDEEKARTRYAAEEQYIKLEKSIREKELELCEIAEFFRGDIPEPREVERIRYAAAEGKRIRNEEAREIGGEYLELSKIYGDGLDFDIIADAEKALRDLEGIDYELQQIEDEKDPMAEEMQRLFTSCPPDKNETERIIAGLGKKSAKVPIMTTIVGIILVVAGVALGNTISPLLYSLVLIGAVLCGTGMVMRAKSSSKGTKEAERYLSLFDREALNPKDALTRLITDTDLYFKLDEDRKKKKSRLAERSTTIRDMLKEFTSSFGISSDDLALDLKRIREDYTRYYKLRLENESALDGRQTRLKTAESLLTQSRDFLARFNTVTSMPFDEIMSKVDNYRILSDALERERTLALEIKEKYGVSGILPEKIDESVNSKESLEEKEVLIDALTRDIGVLNDDYERTAREAENITVVEADLALLEEKYEKYKSIYSTIQKTSALLSEAYEAMNARYIGKTRERFLKYEAAIGGDGGEYTVGYSFEVQKNEMGAMHAENSYSRGTRDLISLAMRLALTDSLFEGEEPFIILDDPFIALDDKKIKKGRALLAELARDRQVLYFTCSEARKI